MSKIYVAVLYHNPLDEERLSSLLFHAIAKSRTPVAVSGIDRCLLWLARSLSDTNCVKLMVMEKERYYRFSTHLRETFGYQVRKVPIDAGLTCPNRDGTKGTGGCLYCDAHGSGPGGEYHNLTVTEQINRWIGKRRGTSQVGYIAYFQAFTSTHTTPDRLRTMLRAARSHHGVVGIAVGTRPDCLPASILEVIKEAASSTYFWLEIGLQTANPKTLALINRQHTVEDFSEAVGRARALGVRICTHVILGLPGEEDEDFRKTADLIAGLGIEGVKIHPLHVLRGSKLLELYRRGEIRLFSLEEYAHRVVDFLERIPSDVLIHRLTGERSPDVLVAPAWCLDKNRLLRTIRNLLNARNTFQGRFYPNPCQDGDHPADARKSEPLVHKSTTGVRR